AFSPQISPPERFALRGGSKPLIRPSGTFSPRGRRIGPASVLAQRLLFLSPSGRGWIGRSPRRVRGMGGRVFVFHASACRHPLPASLGLSAKLRYLPRQGGGGVRCLGQRPAIRA